MSTRRGLVLAGVAVVAAAGAAPLAAATNQAAGGGGANLGSFSQPFQEAGIPNGAHPNCTAAESFAGKCLPTAVSAAVMANGRILFWNGLEGSERSNIGTVPQFGALAAPDQSRVLDLGNLTFTKPSPIAGGSTNPAPDLFLPGTPYTQGANDALFCSSLLQLTDGRVIAVGGTDYYDEPGIPGTSLGVSELQGLKDTRIFNPSTLTWSESGQMHFGRWYPSAVTLPSGQIFVASGVTKLIKPVYSNDLIDSGTNVRQTETYDPATGTWSYNGKAGDRSLPLFPRLHLLPDGKVYYDAAGQVFNPDGQSYDEATWNIAAVYNPATKSWKGLTIPGLGTTYPGFKGSTFSIMLPLAPPYSAASFLGAGGVYGTTPGGYLANNASLITTIDTAHGDKLSSVQTGTLHNDRWYSTGVLLPDESVMAFSGAKQDGVVLPGFEIPVHQAERFDPTTNTWTAMASGHRDRTYHNTAELLPDGSVLVGGHSPIPLGYGTQKTLPGGITANNEKDPSFEIYYPPYFSGVRPTITGAPGLLSYNSSFTVSTPQAAAVKKVILVRNTSITHLVDADQRTVELAITSRSASGVTVAMPSSTILPPGPYMLFVDVAGSNGKGLVPSTAVQTFVGVGSVPAWATTGRNAQVALNRTASMHSSGTAMSAASHVSGMVQQAPAAQAVTAGAATLAETPVAALPERRTPNLGLAALIGLGAALIAGYVTRRRLLRDGRLE